MSPAELTVHEPPICQQGDCRLLAIAGDEHHVTLSLVTTAGNGFHARMLRSCRHVTDACCRCTTLSSKQSSLAEPHPCDPLTRGGPLAQLFAGASAPGWPALQRCDEQRRAASGAHFSEARSESLVPLPAATPAAAAATLLAGSNGAGGCSSRATIDHQCSASPTWTCI